MGSEWSDVLLEDVVKLRNGAGIKQQFFTKSFSGVPLVKVSNFSLDSIVMADLTLVDENHADSWKSHRLVVDDVLVATVGSWPPNWSSVVGKVVRAPQESEGALQNQNTCCLVPNSNIDKHFLYYRLKTTEFVLWVANVAQGSANQARVPVKQLGKYNFKLPPIDHQRSIGSVLRAFDNKIQLNRQINQTLEAMAQALFKSWFVDFDPVIDNALAAGNAIPEALTGRAEQRRAVLAAAQDGGSIPPADGAVPVLFPESTRALFPDAFVFDAEMGWVPEGWEVGTFGDIALHVRDNVKPENIDDSSLYVGLEHISKKQLMLSDAGLGEDVSSNKSGFEERDLLFGKLRPYFHKVCIAPKDGVCSTDILVLRAKHELQHSFMVLTAYTEEFVEYANLRSTGTRMPRASAKDLLVYPLVLPSTRILDAFDKLVSPFWKKGIAGGECSVELSKTRDALLPKLISGELRLSDDQ